MATVHPGAAVDGLARFARGGLGFVVAAILMVSTAGAAPDDPGVPGLWRVTLGVAAPWSHLHGPVPDTRAWLGLTVDFAAEQVTGPGSLSCDHVRYESIASPAQGLFQGLLPEPAETAARNLGLARFPVTGVRLSCATGVFDLHRADAENLLLGVDNVIWTLNRSPGALADPATPNGRVQALLERHFSADMGFDEISVANKRELLSERLSQRIDAYFASEFPADEAPPINGDPFTDSQEYPVRFSVGDSAREGDLAAVPVRFADGWRERTVVYVLREEHGQWQVDDLRFERGMNLGALLELLPDPSGYLLR